jgi:hypothetical protein
VSGAAALTTTATISSPAGRHTRSFAAQGTLSAANYTFRFVNGTSDRHAGQPDHRLSGSLGAQTAGTDVDLAALASSSSGLTLGICFAYALGLQGLRTVGFAARGGLLHYPGHAGGQCRLPGRCGGHADLHGGSRDTETGHQTVTFPPIGTQMAATTVNLKATASSGLPVAFVSLTPSVCTVSGARPLTLIAYGFCYDSGVAGGKQPILRERLPHRRGLAWRMRTRRSIFRRLEPMVCGNDREPGGHGQFGICR